MRQVPRALIVLAVAALAIVPIGAAQASLRPYASAPQLAQRAPGVTAARCARNQGAGVMTFVSPFGYDASAGILDIFAAKALGYFDALCVKVDISIPSFSLSPYSLVSSGRGTVTGEGSAADDLTEVADGANLVALSTFADTSDYALLSGPKITSLKDLTGKTLGYHTQIPVVLSEMLSRAGVDIAKVHTVNDISYDPRLLIEGKFDALQAYQSNEPLQLQAEGYPPGKAFREWLPSSFGVQGTFNVQLVNGTFLAKHRGTVADFMRAELRATAYCIAHQASCVALEQAAAASAKVTYDKVHALAEWRYEVGLIVHHGLAGKGIGVETQAEWRSEAQAVLAYKLVKSAPVLSRVEDTSLVASLYRGTSLIWP